MDPVTKDIAIIRAEFIEKVGLIAQADSVPRSAGRVLGLLIWDGEPVSFADLAEKLQVSRASVSTATRMPEERRLIRRIAKPGQRKDYFQIADNPYEKMLDVIRANVARAKDDIDLTLAEIPQTEPGIRRRVGAYSAFYGLVQSAVSQTTDQTS